jgi:RHS repeat-associated protein
MYEYDGAGRRVTKTANGNTTVYVYDGAGQLAAEYGGAAGVGTQYLTADALGSTRLVTDSAGAVVRSYDYLPFGEELRAGTAGRDSTFPPASPPAPDNATGIKAGFTGKERDAETGLDYFGARYFSGAQGRFTSSDQPLIDQDAKFPQSWNLYSYVRNNPLKYTDPNGEDCVYTNNYNNDGTVTVERGDCSQKNGTFINGTIDTKSLTVHNGNLEFGYSDPNGALGVHSMGLPEAPDPGLLALQRGTQLAEPGVNLAAEGLRMFGYIVNAPLMGLAECAAKGKDCSAASTAMAMIPGGEGETAAQIIAKFRAGSVLREFPGQYLNSTLKEIQRDAKQGSAVARKALKLLKDTRDKFTK